MDLNPECKLFIGGLSKSTKLETLKGHFGRWGKLVDSVVIGDSKTKISRGFGFVTYSQLEEVDECLKHGPHVIDGRQVDVKRAVPKESGQGNNYDSPKSKKVFLGGLPLTITEHEIEDEMDEFGTIEEVVIIKEKNSTAPRGFGFVIYKDLESADKACVRRHVKFKNYRDRDIEVKPALSMDEMRRTERDSRHRPLLDRDRDRDRYENRGTNRRDDYYGGGRTSSYRDDRFDSYNYPPEHTTADPYYHEPSSGYHGMGSGPPLSYPEREPTYPSSYRSSYEGGSSTGYELDRPSVGRGGSYGSEVGGYGSGGYNGANTYGPGGSNGYNSWGSGGGGGGGGYGSGGYSSGLGGYGGYSGNSGSGIGPIKSHDRGIISRVMNDGRTGPYGGMGVHPSSAGGYGGGRNPGRGSREYHPYRR